MVTAIRTSSSLLVPRSSHGSQGRADRPLGVVLVAHRRSEKGQHGVADELVDGPAEALDLRSAAVRGRTRSIAFTSSGSADPSAP